MVLILQKAMATQSFVVSPIYFFRAEHPLVKRQTDEATSIAGQYQASTVV